MSTPEHDLLHTRLSELTRALRKLHKALIDAATREFAEPVGSALEHLQLITNHPHFAWLLKLSGAMAELDERLDDAEQPLDTAAANGLRQGIEALIGPAPAIDPAFREKYTALLHASPEVVMAHGAVRQQLDAVGPRPPAPASK
ncbi:MAG: hypothetical protein ACJ8HI_03985 [Massilia sp.]